MSIEIYLDHISQPARAVLSLCNLGNLDVKITSLRLFKNEHRADNVLKINPLRTIPFIIDHENKDFRVTESQAIMKYLLRTRSKNFRESLYPSDPIKAAKVDEYLDWHHSNTRRTAYYILSINMPGTEKAMGYEKEALSNTFENALRVINDYFLAEGKFIGGLEEFTIADLSAYFELLQLIWIKFDYSKYTNLSAWMRKMTEVKEIQAANKEFYQITAKITKGEVKPKF